MINQRISDLAFFYPIGHEAHYQAGHVERPERVETIRKVLQSNGWWDKYPNLNSASIPESVLYKVHDPTWIVELESLCRQGSSLGLDSYLTPSTYKLALNAAGGAAEVALSIWRGEARSGE